MYSGESSVTMIVIAVTVLFAVFGIGTLVSIRVNLRKMVDLQRKTNRRLDNIANALHGGAAAGGSTGGLLGD